MLKGKFIAPDEMLNVFCVKKDFTLDKSVRAKINITALGLFVVHINGKRVGDEYLTPGWTSYNNRLQVIEYDITEYLNIGKNTVVITVGEGWYRGRLMRNDGGCVFGDKTAVCADIVCGDNLIVTDESWITTDSIIRFSGIYDGETVDHTYIPIVYATTSVDFDKRVLVERIGEPVRAVETLSAVNVIDDPDGGKIYDFGQNIAGVVEIVPPKDFCGTITLKFAEILVDGKFYTDNLRSAKATDVFIVNGGDKKLSPEFTYHGFRYVKITGADLPIENITAVVRRTDLKRTGYIYCDDPKFMRLMDNVLWSMRDNFVDIPTDCPQRDERLGWTSDINVFTETAAFFYDIAEFMKKWLADVRVEQDEKGRIPRIIPNVLPIDEKRTSAMWCDCIIMIPYKLYLIYGDKSFIEDNYAAMQNYICAKEDTFADGLIATGAEYGDWLALDSEAMFCDDPFGRTDKYFVSNALYSHCLDIMIRSARLLKRKDDVRLYSEKYKKHLRAIRNEYFSHNGRICFDTVSAQVLALQFGLVTPKNRSSLAAQLNANVIRHGCTVTTGFTGTAYILYALADNGYIDTAVKLLMNEKCPGWLYPVNMGATTIWERWDSLMPNGMPNSSGMNSYNHYAFGSVADFVVKRIAGITPLSAGYRSIAIAPNVVSGINELSVNFDSPNGKIMSAYKICDNKVRFTVETPPEISTKVVLPNGATENFFGGKHIYNVEINKLLSGVK